jgi:hypothetical protein
MGATFHFTRSHDVRRACPNLGHPLLVYLARTEAGLALPQAAAKRLDLDLLVEADQIAATAAAVLGVAASRIDHRAA